MFALKDQDGTVKVILFPAAYANCQPTLRVGAVVMVTGVIRLRADIVTATAMVAGIKDEPTIYATQVISK